MASVTHGCVRDGDSMHGCDLPSSIQTIIIGGGMGGLASALALAKMDRSRQLLILERDPEPPEIDPSRAFEEWKRPGVPQLRHTHLFLGRFQSILREHHPEVLEELLATGAELGTWEEAVPRTLVQKWVPEAGDENLYNIWARRTTVEYVLRRHVGRLPNVRFVHGVQVENLIVEARGGELQVTGVEVRSGGALQRVAAELVVDTSGVRSPYVEQLRGEGAAIKTESTPSECGYYCRHYEQIDPSSGPKRSDGNGHTLDYVVYGIFFAEHGRFSIAYACPESEQELLAALKRADGFDEVCNLIPGAARWTRSARPVSRVLGGADLANRWHRFPTKAGSQVLGFFPVGDSLIRTNPIYGRGCSSAFVQAHALADAVASSRDPRARARTYHREVETLMRPHFQFCMAADSGFLARSKHVRGERMSAIQQLFAYGFQSVFLPAVEESQFVAREWWKMQQMGKASGGLVFLMVLAQMAWLWLKRNLSGRRWQLPVQGPSREHMLAAITARAAKSEPESAPRVELDPSEYRPSL